MGLTLHEAPRNVLIIENDFCPGFCRHIRLILLKVTNEGAVPFVPVLLGIGRRRATLSHELKQCQLLSADVDRCTNGTSMKAPLGSAQDLFLIARLFFLKALKKTIRLCNCKVNFSFLV